MNSTEKEVKEIPATGVRELYKDNRDDVNSGIGF